MWCLAPGEYGVRMRGGGGTGNGEAKGVGMVFEEASEDCGFPAA